MKCKKCDFDMGECYVNNGASDDGVCNYCGFDQKKSTKIGTNLSKGRIHAISNETKRN